MRRLAPTVLAAAIALLALPAGAPAAQIFGSDLLQQPNQTDCEMFGPCTVAAFVEVPAEGQLSSAGSPIDGVITSFRLRAVVAAPAQVTLRVADVHPIDEGEGPNRATAAIAGTGPTVTVQPADDEAAPQSFAARLPVSKGQHLALDGPAGLIATHDSSGSKFSYEFVPQLLDGAAASNSTEFLGELLVQATVEPDADGDGFGDETQDGCPSQKTTQGPCDNAKPAISGLRVARGKVFYRLSEASTVSIVVARRVRRRGFRQIGRSFSGPGNQGANRVRLPRARSLRRGAYRVTLTATDVAGNRSVRRAAFKVRG